MATLTNPAEIARQTLKMLLARRMSPSPDNYEAIYNEIAGIRGRENAPFPERELKALLLSLPRETPGQQGLVRQLDQAVRSTDWESFRAPLADFIREHSSESGQPWAELISEMLRQWEAKQGGLTPARKRETLEHILKGSATNSELLFGRLQNLVRSWSQSETAPEGVAMVGEVAELAEPHPPAAAGAAAGSPISRASELLPELRELFAYTLESIVAAQVGDDPELAARARSLAAAARNTATVKAAGDLLADIRRFAFRLEFVAEDRAEIRAGLHHLLQLMIDNVSEIVADDRWLNGQIEMVRDIVAQPMNVRSINDAERRLKEVIYKQSQLRHSLSEAREALKQMLAGFIDHLAEFADSTSDYHDRMEVCVARIGEAEDISQLKDVLGDVMNETRGIQLNAQRSRDELRLTRGRMEEAEKRIDELQQELDKASRLVRHDQLTGALNRRGLEEIFASEAARSNRRRTPLSVALLDIDNFKKLNDSLGHGAGDAALVHLVSVIRGTLRPNDTLARFGGEEFIILLSDTALADANTALVRLQRELTRRYFLNNNEKILITFSAGLTELRGDDTLASVTQRADEAMYTAKKTGKNRVVAV